MAVYQDISGHGQGTTASADLYASLPPTGWLFSIGPGLTWANAIYTPTLFGVTPQQSSGCPITESRRELTTFAALNYRF